MFLTLTDGSVRNLALAQKIEYKTAGSKIVVTWGTGNTEDIPMTSEQWEGIKKFYIRSKSRF